MKTNTAASAVELDLEIELHRSTEGMGKEEIAELREQLRLMGRQLEDMAYFVGTWLWRRPMLLSI